MLNERITFVVTTIRVQISPDPKDDFLLALCEEFSSDYLLTGNKVDLLELRRHKNTRILSLSEFLDLDLSGSTTEIPAE